MRLVWVVISLMLFGIIGITESDAQCVQGSQEPCMDEIFVLQYNTIPHDSFDLQITKEVFFKSENIHVRLLNIEDSRCPSDVQCVWEGRATVDINVSSGTPVTFEPQEDLGNYSISLNESLDGSLIQLDQYSLQLLKVEPYPTSIESIPEWDYVATMKFSKIEVLSPLKQVNNGVSLESITCKDKLELVFKSSNNSPACVKPETAEKLMERGWMKNNVLPLGLKFPLVLFRITDILDNSLASINVKEETLLVTDLANEKHYEQPYVLEIIIENFSGEIVKTFSIDGVLKSGESISPSVSWIPEQQGHYVIKVSLWEDINSQKLLGTSQSNLEVKNNSKIINGCKDVGGTWLDEYNECEYAGNPEAFENYCTDFNGKYGSCASGCRHSLDYPDVVCTTQCFAVCEFD